MSGERIIHVYRVTHVAEHVVEDDGIYEDDVDLLRDVLGAARQGSLEFERSDCDFVALNHGEDATMTVKLIEVEGLEERLTAKSSEGLPPPEAVAVPRQLDESPAPRPRVPSPGRRRRRSR